MTFAGRLHLLRAPLLAGLLGVALSGCYEDDRYRYLSHGTTNVLDAGNASAVNRATHTIDPWPPESDNDRIDQDGKRAHIAVERYETNTVVEPKGLGTQKSGIDVNVNDNRTNK